MVDGIGMALTSLKAASDLAKSLIELRDAAKIGEVSIELNGKIAAAQQLALSAQQEQATFVRRIDELEKQVVQFENWEREKESYELHEIRDGAFVYRLKESMKPSEPRHNICSQCYEKRHKSILQSEIWNPNRSQVLVCKSCDAVIYISGGPSQHHAGSRR